MIRPYTELELLDFHLSAHELSTSFLDLKFLLYKEDPKSSGELVVHKRD